MMNEKKTMILSMDKELQKSLKHIAIDMEMKPSQIILNLIEDFVKSHGDDNV